MTEKLRLWHPYQVDFVRRGHRKAERLTTRGPVDLDVPVLSASELPVVGRVVKGDGTRAMRGTADDGSIFEYRGWGGSLWMPMRSTDGR